MHAKKITLFWCMENTIWFFSFEILGCMHKKHFFFKFVFVLFKSWWKPCILIPDFYFYDVKYIPILSKKRHKSKRVEIITIEKYFFLLIFFWNGLGRPSPTTWAEPSPCEQCSSLFTCYMNNGGVAGTAKVAEKVDLWWRRGGAAGGGGCNGAAGGTMAR